MSAADNEDSIMDNAADNSADQAEEEPRELAVMAPEGYVITRAMEATAAESQPEMSSVPVKFEPTAVASAVSVLIVVTVVIALKGAI